MSEPHHPPPDPRRPAPRPERPPGTFRIGSVAGSDVLVTSSWFVVAGLIAFVMAPAVEETAPGLGAWKYVAGFAFAIVLYLSVLLHEASHALMAKRYGFPVTSITLHFLGGMTAIEGESRRPREEFMIAVVGPLTSIAVGVAAGALYLVTPDGLLLLAVGGLAGANLLVGVLNLVPGLPLDGGRVLRSGVWKLTGSMHTGTIVAGWGGRVTAVVALAYPLLMEALLDTRADMVDFVLAVVIALFLWSGATAGHGVGAAAPQAAGAGGPRPRPPHHHRPRRPAARRGRTPCPGGRGRQHRHRHQRRPSGRAGQRGGRCSPPRRTAARGSRSPPSAGPSTTGSACPPTSRGRT